MTDDWDAFAKGTNRTNGTVSHEDRVRLVLDWRKAFADAGPDDKQSARGLDVVVAFVSGVAIGGALVGWLMW